MAEGSLVATMQPPVMGLNLASPVISLDPREALTLDNILPKAASAALRKGYQDQVINIPGVINTIASFIGNRGADSRTFAFNDEGSVFDVTKPTKEPAAILKTLQIDGIWDFTNTTGVAENYLCMVSPEGGYYTYSKGDGLVKRELTGAAAGKKFSAIFNWKDRVWLIEAESCVAYYLGIGAIQGAAEKFDFAPVINQGGYLAYGSNWTFNAGVDIDDYLVLVTTSGEVVVYSGYDPSAADTFTLKGVWYVGAVPAGVRAYVQFGGELFIISALGVIPMSKLVNGGVVNHEEVSSFKIQPLLTDLFNERKDQFGWEMEMIYNQSFLLLKVPPKESTNTHQYFVMNAQTGAWGTISGMPMRCTTQVNNQILFGTIDGRVCVAFIGDSDGQTIDEEPGKPIIGSYMSGFNGYGSDGSQKIFNLVRPIFVGARAPRVTVKMVTETGAPLPTINSPALNTPESRFDINRWDECRWVGALYTYATWLGVNGMGFYGALSMRYAGAADTQYVSSNLTFTKGGVM